MITGAETAHLGLRPAPIYLEGRLPVLEAKVAGELGLHDGQVVQATAEPRSGALQLLLQTQGSPQRGLELPRELVATMRLVAGDTVTFRVQVAPSGVITLRPVNISSGEPKSPDASSPAASPVPKESAPAASNASVQASRNSAATASSAAAASTASTAPAQTPDDSRIEQLLTRPSTLNTLEQVLRPDVLAQFAKSTPLPEVQAALVQWMRMRPQMATLTADRLMQYLSVSGWFTEAALAQGRVLGALDLKSVLRLLARSASQPATSGTLHQALDEVESQQVAATGVGASGDVARDWGFSMVIPFADADPMTLRFSQRRPQPPQPPGEEPPPLYVHMHTRSRDHGELWLQTCIRERTQVEMVMWAVREDVADRARAQSSNLAEELASAGLRMAQFQVIHGPRPSELPQWQAPQAQGRWVDVHT